MVLSMKFGRDSYWNIVKYFFYMFIPSLLLIGGVFIKDYRKEISNEKAIIQSRQMSYLAVQSGVINNYFKNLVSDLKFLSSMVEIRMMFPNIGVKEERVELTEEFLAFCRAKPSFDQIRVLNAAGREMIRVDCNHGDPYITPEIELQDKGERYYFEEAISYNKGEIYVSAFDLNVERGIVERPIKPVIRFATPVVDLHDQKKGIIVLNRLGVELINSFKVANRDTEGHVMLINREGFWLAGMKPELEWGFMYEDGGDKRIGKEYPEEWRKFKGRESGQFRTANGLFTFKTIYPRQALLREAVNLDKSIVGTYHGHFNKNEAYWKIITHVMSDKLNRGLESLKAKYIKVFSFLVLSLALVLLFFAFSIAGRKEAENRTVSYLLQQEAIAKLGKKAMVVSDLDEFFKDALSTITEIIGVEYSKILELLPEDNALLLRAGVGWKEGLVGQATVDTGKESQAGYTLHVNGPVVVKDLNKEKRFDGPPLLFDHGVVSGMSVVIPGKNQTFGVLGVHTTTRRDFSKNDINFLQSISNMLGQVIDHKISEKKVSKSMEELEKFNNLAIGRELRMIELKREVNKMHSSSEYSEKYKIH